MLIYYINLAHRTDRRAAIEAQLDLMGLPATRIEGVTPADLEPGQLQRHCDRRSLRWSTPAELSCSLSHHAALRAFLASNDSHALILEDDVILAPGLPALLTEPMPDCDILRLETFVIPQHLGATPEGRMAQGALFAIHGWCWGTAAYVISRRGAWTLLADTAALSTPFDQTIFNRYRGPGAHLQSWQLVPALAIQSHHRDHVPAVSDIGQVTPAPSGKSPFREKLHGFLRWWETEIAMGLPKSLNLALKRTTRGIVPFAGD